MPLIACLPRQILPLVRFSQSPSKLESQVCRTACRALTSNAFDPRRRAHPLHRRQQRAVAGDQPAVHVPHVRQDACAPILHQGVPKQGGVEGAAATQGCRLACGGSGGCGGGGTAAFCKRRRLAWTSQCSNSLQSTRCRHAAAHASSVGAETRASAPSDAHFVAGAIWYSLPPSSTWYTCSGRRNSPAASAASSASKNSASIAWTFSEACQRRTESPEPVGAPRESPPTWVSGCRRHSAVHLWFCVLREAGRL